MFQPTIRINGSNTTEIATEPTVELDRRMKLDA